MWIFDFFNSMLSALSGDNDNPPAGEGPGITNDG